jgi:DNA repair protein RecN (Recombination protein N)
VLRTLSIKNFALIDELEVEFGPGLNVITGETGAGKSIIVGALGLILGERADSTAVRAGAEKAVVEGIFTAPGDRKVAAVLERNGIDPGEELILRRELSAKGQSRAFINDTPATIAVLKEVGDLLVDIHGQHDHQSLLRVETHRVMLDDFGRLGSLAGEFGTAYREAAAARAALVGLRAREEELRERRSLVEFQLSEIDAVGPEAGEEDRLEQELTILENSEKLFAATERLYAALYDGENAVHDRLVLARNELEDLVEIDPSFAQARDEAASASAIVDELAKFIQSYNSRIEYNPERLEEIRDRLGALALLRKKYGGSLDAVVERRGALAAELSLADNFEAETARASARLEECVARASEIAQRLSQKRRETGKQIGSSIVGQLRDLGMPHASFETSIVNRETAGEGSLVRLGRTWYEATENGMDAVEFHVSANKGEEPKPLARVASGGEISRIMLAMKMILARSDRLPLLIFDEIDSGVSGRVARSVGESMKKLSQYHQMISITHLPQIAGCADIHYVVEKTEEKKRTVTSMKKLDPEGRVREVAKLMSGAEITGAALNTARELIDSNDRPQKGKKK